MSSDEANMDQTGFRAIVFTDVENSTALQAQRGDEVARRIVRTSEELSVLAVERHGGRVLKHTGDGLLASFPSSRRAVRASLEAVESVREHSRANPDQAVRIRVGIHAGEVIDETDDIHGAAVSAAARICALADGGEILTSEVVHSLCGPQSGFAFSPRGRFELKGFDQRWPVLAVSADDSVGQAHQTHYVGRRSTMNQLLSILERTANGRGSMVLISGEAGVGKTRFMHEVRRAARERGMLSNRGYCYATGSEVPYGPWVNLIETATESLDDDAVKKLLGPYAPVLAQLVPGLRRRLPDIETPVEVPGDQQQTQLFNTLRSFIADSAVERPLLLIIEDVHWADEASIAVLEHMAEWIDELPVVVLASHRNARTEGTPALRRALGTLARRPNADIIRLDPLDESEIAEMLGYLAGSPPPQPIIDAFVQRTGGNTFFVEEMFRHLSDNGQLLDQAGNYLPVDLSDAQIPATVKLVIDQQIEALSDEARQLVDRASVFAGPIPEPVLEELSGLSLGSLLDALDDAVNHQFLTEVRVFGGSYRFRHDLVRHAVADDLSDLRRAAYHFQAAQALEAVFPERLDELAANIVGHLLQAGSRVEDDQLIRFLLLAGERALHTAAHQDAVRYLEQAEQLHQHRDLPRAQLLVKLGTAHLSLGQWDEASSVWQQAIELFDDLGEPHAGAELCGELARQLIWAYRFADMAQIAARGLAMLGEDDSPQRPWLTIMMGLAASLGGKVEQAELLVATAVEAAEKPENKPTRGSVRCLESTYHYFYMEYPEAAIAGRRAVSELRESSDKWTLCDAMSMLDISLTYSGDFDEAAELRSELDLLARKIGHHGASTIGGRNAFVATAVSGQNLDGLDDLVANQLAVAGATGNLGWIGTGWALSGIVSFWRGDWSSAETSLVDAATSASSFWVGPQQALLTLFYAYQQDQAKVGARLAEFESLLASSHDRNIVGAWNASVITAEAVSMVGMTAEAEALYPVVLGALETGAVIRQLDGRLIQTVAAMVADTAGHTADAERHFERALAQADTINHMIEQPHVRHFFGRFLSRSDEASQQRRGRHMLQQAIQMYESIGMHRHAALAAEASAL